MDDRPDNQDKAECAVLIFGTMADPGLTRLTSVLAIARRKSFRAAALELGVSTTALSSTIAKLERELGVRLFNRTTRSVALTEAGRAFVEQVGPALDIIREAMEAVRSHQGTPSGTLRINAFATAAREAFAPLIREYVQRYPGVHVDLVTEGRLVDIVADGYDFGIRSQDMVPVDMIAVPLGGPRSFAVVGSPAYFAAHGRPQHPGDLRDHACIRVRLPDGGLFRWKFQRSGELLHLDVDGPITLDEATLARMAVLENVGIGYFMESDVREDLDAGRLIQILPDWTPSLPPVCLYYPSRRNSSAAFQAFVNLARELADR